MIFGITTVWSTRFPTRPNFLLIRRGQYIFTYKIEPRTLIHPEHIAILFREQGIEFSISLLLIGAKEKFRRDSGKVIGDRSLRKCFKNLELGFDRLARGRGSYQRRKQQKKYDTTVPHCIISDFRDHTC